MKARRSEGYNEIRKKGKKRKKQIKKELDEYGQKRRK
jgi:hypothetical protein